MLEKLLGSEGKGKVAKPQTNGDHLAQDEFELELDFEDLSLREFVSRDALFARREQVYATQTVEECTFCQSMSQSCANSI